MRPSNSKAGPPFRRAWLIAGAVLATALAFAPRSRTEAALGTAARPSRQEQAASESPAQHYFTDVKLVDQDGVQLRFYSDLLRGRVVIIDSFFSKCTGSCPVLNATMEKVQDWLGDRLGKDAILMSVTVDPDDDTPQVLKEYSRKFKARPGWYFLTGDKSNVELALGKIGEYTGEKEDHSNILIIGNLRTGLWKKAFGLARPEQVIDIVASVLSDGGAPAQRGQ